MVFLQIYLSVANDTFYFLGLSGNYTCKIVDIQYTYTSIPHKPGDQDLILISPSFTFINSNIPLPLGTPQGRGFMFTNNSDKSVFRTGVTPSCTVNLLNGINLSIVDASTFSTPIRFKSCILTLELIQIP